MPVLRQYLDFQRHISLSCLYCMISCESWLLFSKPGKGEVMYMHVSRILFASVSTVRRLDFRIVPLVCMGGGVSCLIYVICICFRIVVFSCVRLCLAYTAFLWIVHIWIAHRYSRLFPRVCHFCCCLCHFHTQYH